MMARQIDAQLRLRRCPFPYSHANCASNCTGSPCSAFSSRASIPTLTGRDGYILHTKGILFMRFTLSLGSAIAAAAAPLILAACSSGAAQVSPSAAQGAVAPLAVSAASSALNKNSHLRIVDLASVKAQVDVAQYSSGPTFPGVTEYAAHNKKNGPPFCEIGGLVQVIGIETDASGNLWVPQQATIDGPGEVIEYAPDCGTAGTKLSVPNGWAVDLG